MKKQDVNAYNEEHFLVILFLIFTHIPGYSTIKTYCKFQNSKLTPQIKILIFYTLYTNEAHIYIMFLLLVMMESICEIT